MTTNLILGVATLILCPGAVAATSQAAAEACVVAGFLALMCVVGKLADEAVNRRKG